MTEPFIRLFLMLMPLLLVGANVSAQVPPPAATHPDVSKSPFTVTGRIRVGENPHGIRFSPDGKLAFVACSVSDEISIVDCEAGKTIRSFPAGKVPLDLVPLPGTDHWIITQFLGNELIEVEPAEGKIIRRWVVGRGPSEFKPVIVNNQAIVVCEDANHLVVFDLAKGEVSKTIATGKDPYPCDVTRDGKIAYVPNRLDHTVSVIDLIEGKTIQTIKVGSNPSGGALTDDDKLYLVACRNGKSVVFIETQTNEVIALVEEGIGVGPFAVVIWPGDEYAFVNNTVDHTVSVIDIKARQVVQVLDVEKQPIIMRMHPDGKRLFVSNESSRSLSIIEPSTRPEKAAATLPATSQSGD